MKTITQFKATESSQPHPLPRPARRLALAVFLLCMALLPAILDSAEPSDPEPAAPGVVGSGVFDTYIGQVTFNFRARQADDTSILGRFSLCDPTADVCITNAAIRTLSIVANAATFGGSGRLEDGSQVRFNVNVQDNGPDIKDSISVQMSTGYKEDGLLVSGDIQVYD